MHGRPERASYVVVGMRIIPRLLNHTTARPARNPPSEAKCVCEKGHSQRKYIRSIIEGGLLFPLVLIVSKTYPSMWHSCSIASPPSSFFFRPFCPSVPFLDKNTDDVGIPGMCSRKKERETLARSLTHDWARWEASLRYYWIKTDKLQWNLKMYAGHRQSTSS